MIQSYSSSNLNTVIEHFDCLSASGDWSRLYAIADGFSYHFHVRRARVLELLPENLGKVIDIGCGPGVMVEAVLERGGTFEGFDLSPEMVREGRLRFARRTNVSFQAGNIEALGLPDNSYDQVICMAVIEYLNSPDLAMSEIARVLRPNGIAIVTVPKRVHVDHFMTRLMTPLRRMAHAWGAKRSDNLPRLCLQPDELDRAAQRAGLKPSGGAQYHFTPLPYPLPRLAPAFCLRLNAPFERLHSTRTALLSFFAHGYVGRYRKLV